MAKNAEAKIQQAQIKEQKYQQELEFQKKNNPNFRDYDENPLVIKSYEKFFVLTLFISSLMFSGVFFWLIKDLYDGVNLQDSNFWKFGIFPTIYIIIVAMFQKFKYKNHTIKFTNKYIEFYDDGKLKRQCEIIYDELARLFFANDTIRYNNLYDLLFFIIPIVIFIYISFIDLKFIVFVISFYLSNFLIQLCFYVFINVSLKGFKIFPFIRIANETYPMRCVRNPTARYFMIYLHNNEVYNEVKKYFLQKNINIDNLPKKYNFI